MRGREPFAIPDPRSPSRSPIVPSWVAVNRNGETLVGEDARPWINWPGHGVCDFKPLLGTGETVSLQGKAHRPEEMSSLILKYLRQNAEEALDTIVRDVVLSVPANFEDPAKQATMTSRCCA